jgi:hypothetical protein
MSSIWQSGRTDLAENIQAELQSWAELKDVVSELWLSGSRAKGRLISGQRRRYRASVDACRAGTRLSSRRLLRPRLKREARALWLPLCGRRDVVPAAAGSND